MPNINPFMIPKSRMLPPWTMAVIAVGGGGYLWKFRGDDDHSGGWATTRSPCEEELNAIGECLERTGDSHLLCAKYFAAYKRCVQKFSS
jgi:hypothetical protein